VVLLGCRLLDGADELQIFRCFLGGGGGGVRNLENKFDSFNTHLIDDTQQDAKNDDSR
jgi:hypothetical protein